MKSLILVLLSTVLFACCAPSPEHIQNAKIAKQLYSLRAGSTISTETVKSLDRWMVKSELTWTQYRVNLTEDGYSPSYGGLWITIDKDDMVVSIQKY